MTFRLRWAFALAVSAISAPGMSVVLNPDVGLGANSAALAAFQRAATTWSSMFSDPFTVTINAGLANLGAPNIIGQANASFLQADYNFVRNAIVADAADETSNGIVASLPTAVQFLGTVPAGFSFDGNIFLTTANLNALGFNLILSDFGFNADGTITFNNNFAFDYDNSNGVTAGQIDFETVALHEIGHVLGFISAVDDVDFLRSTGRTAAIGIAPLDLFRFATGQTPTTATQFRDNPRNFVPNAAAGFSDTVNTWALSTGAFTGDGNQASHWKDNSLTGVQIGVMDPTLSFGVVSSATYADARAFDLIGYDLVAVPEPGTFALMGVGLASLAYWRKRRS